MYKVHGNVQEADFPHEGDLAALLRSLGFIFFAIKGFKQVCVWQDSVLYLKKTILMAVERMELVEAIWAMACGRASTKYTWKMFIGNN